MTEAEINKFMPALHELSPFLVDSGKEAKIKTGTFLHLLKRSVFYSATPFQTSWSSDQ